MAGPKTKTPQGINPGAFTKTAYLGGVNLKFTPALTTSMRVAWQIAAEVALIAPEECDRLVTLQLQTIERELARSCPQAECETLTDMQAEYRQHSKPTLAMT